MNRLWLLVLVWCCLCQPVWAGDPLFIDLSGTWQTAKEEVYGELPTSGWADVEIDAEGASDDESVVWYRKRADVPEKWSGRSLALSIETRAEIQVFIDGEPLVSPSETTREASLGPGLHVIAIPQHGGSIRVAVRSRVEDRLLRYEVPRISGDALFLGPADVVATAAPVTRREVTLRRRLPSILTALLFIVAGLFHLGLYWRRPELKAYLWYGTHVSLLAAWEILGTYDALFFLPGTFGDGLGGGLSRLAIAAMVLCLWTLLGGGKIPWWVKVVVAANVVLGLLLSLLGLGWAWFLGPPYQESVGLVGIAVGFYIVVIAAWRGTGSARIILAGVSVQVAFSVPALLGQIGVMTSPPLWTIQIGHVASIAAMSVALMNQFAQALDAASPTNPITTLNFPDKEEVSSPATMANLLAMSTVGEFTGLLSGLADAGSAAKTAVEGRGKMVGRYIIRHRLGRGGMGVVYHAHDPDLARDVAIKLVRDRSASSRRQSLLHREAVAMARCTHPNIITIYDVGVHGGDVFLAMEYLQGATLRRWQEASDTSRSAILQAYLEAGRGLSAAHGAGIVHGDFKADNVMYTDDRRVVVLDFGIARAIQSSGSDVLADALGGTLLGAGTPLFMAPELSAGEGSTRSSDQYAFALSLLAALWEVSPREVADLDGRLGLQSSRQAQEGRLSQTVLSALMRGLSTRSEDRFPSMDALLDELRAT